jgi:hypothetical protein
MSIFHEITSQPQYIGLTALGVIGGGCLGWAAHRAFPGIPIGPAVCVGASFLGGIMSIVVVVRYVIVMATELAEEIEHDEKKAGWRHRDR